MKKFEDFGLNAEIMASLEDLGFVEPTPIQAEVVPFILESKKDLIALAQTGTGKTAAFGLPILNNIKTGKNELQAIILCPTRELCLQISKDLANFAKHSKKVSITSVYGGEGIDVQIRALKKGTEIVVGTPGRVHDLIRRKILKLGSIQWLVLDEADEMLDMGFKDDLDAILEDTPATRQTLLFSATMSKNVYAIAKNYMKEIREISVGDKNAGADNVSHEYYVVRSGDRFEALKRILDSLPNVYGILFCRTRIETQEVADKLKKFHYSAEAIHGEISQSTRTKIMDRFRQKQIHLLVATDVAARGIDVSDLTHVINYNLPDQNETYTHRTGRTGRAKKSGVAISIITPSESRIIGIFENQVGKKFTYKKVPTGEDVFQKQLDNFIEEIKNTEIEKVEDEHYFTEVTEKLKKVTKEELIKYFINYKFSNSINTYKNAYDLNAEARSTGGSRENPNGVNLKINLGKRNGFDIKSLFGMINADRKLKGLVIGKIDLMPDYSIFAVDKGFADEVISYLNTTSFRGQEVEVSITNEVMTYSKPKRDYRGGGNRGGDRGGSGRFKPAGNRFKRSGR